MGREMEKFLHFSIDQKRFQDLVANWISKHGLSGFFSIWYSKAATQRRSPSSVNRLSEQVCPVGKIRFSFDFVLALKVTREKKRGENARCAHRTIRQVLCLFALLKVLLHQIINKLAFTKKLCMQINPRPSVYATY